MKVSKFFCLELIIFSLCACTSSKSMKGESPRLLGIGIVEIENSPNLERRPPAGSFVFPIKVSETDFFVATIGGSFGRFNTTTGSFRWKKTFPVGVASRAVIRGERVYVGALNGIVFAFDSTSGREIWRKRLSTESLGNLVMGNDYLYVSSADNVVWALNFQTGEEQWTLRRPSPNAAYYWSLRGNTAGVLSPDKNLMYLGFSDGVVVCLKALTGEVVWERSFSRSGRFQDADTEPVLSPDGKTLVIALPDHSLQFLRASDGASIDSFPDAAGFFPLIDFKGGTLTYPLANGTVRQYLISTKKLLWELDLKHRGLGVEFQPIGNDEALLTSTHFGLHIIDLKSGRIKSEYYIGEGVVSRPVADASRVFVMTGRGRLVFLKLLPEKKG